MRPVTIPRFALLALVLPLVGCVGAAENTLQNTRTVVSISATTLNKIEPAITRSYRQGLNACLWGPMGKKATTPLAEQETCVDRVQAQHKETTDAYDVAAEVVTSAETTILAAEAALAAGRMPSLVKFLTLAGEVLEVMHKLEMAHRNLRRFFVTPSPGATP